MRRQADPPCEGFTGFLWIKVRAMGGAQDLREIAIKLMRVLQRPGVSRLEPARSGQMCDRTGRIRAQPFALNQLAGLGDPGLPTSGPRPGPDISCKEQRQSKWFRKWDECYY